MKRIFGALLPMIVPCCLHAQSYAVGLVPDSLKKNARAVIREDETILEIKSPGARPERGEQRPK